uniref:RNase H type-1 domain-containing protein n=1 Tax=Chenopodium quinoa TaxID=63459 RepID=A0A803MDU4_CHEQI
MKSSLEFVVFTSPAGKTTTSPVGQRKVNLIVLLLKSGYFVTHLILHYLLNVSARSEPKSFAWDPPPQNFLKINVDASFIKHSKQAGCAGISRDDKGNWIQGFQWKGYFSSAKDAELKAVSLALNWITENGWQNCHIETDCKTIVLELTDRNNTVLTPSIHECRAQLQQLTEVKLCFLSCHVYGSPAILHALVCLTAKVFCWFVLRAFGLDDQVWNGVLFLWLRFSDIIVCGFVVGHLFSADDPLLEKVVAWLQFPSPMYGFIDVDKNNVFVRVNKPNSRTKFIFYGGDSSSVEESRERAAHKAVKRLMCRFSVRVSDFTYERIKMYRLCVKLFKNRCAELVQDREDLSRIRAECSTREDASFHDVHVSLDFVQVLGVLVRKTGVSVTGIETTRLEGHGYMSWLMWMLTTVLLAKISGECSLLREKYLILKGHLECLESSSKQADSVNGLGDDACVTPNDEANQIPVLVLPPSLPAKRRINSSEPSTSGVGVQIPDNFVPEGAFVRYCPAIHDCRYGIPRLSRNSHSRLNRAAQQSAFASPSLPDTRCPTRHSRQSSTSKRQKCIQELTMSQLHRCHSKMIFVPCSGADPKVLVPSKKKTKQTHVQDILGAATDRQLPVQPFRLYMPVFCYTYCCMLHRVSFSWVRCMLQSEVGLYTSMICKTMNTPPKMKLEPVYLDELTTQNIVGVVLFVKEVPRMIPNARGRDSPVREVSITDTSQDHAMTISTWKDLTGKPCDAMSNWAEKFNVVGFTTLKTRHTRGEAVNATPDEIAWIKVTIPEADLQRVNAYIGCLGCGKRTHLALGTRFPCISCKKGDIVAVHKTATEIWDIKATVNFEAFKVVQAILATKPFFIQVTPTLELARNSVLLWTLKTVEVEDAEPQGQVLGSSSLQLNKEQPAFETDKKYTTYRPLMQESPASACTKAHGKGLAISDPEVTVDYNQDNTEASDKQSGKGITISESAAPIAKLPTWNKLACTRSNVKNKQAMAVGEIMESDDEDQGPRKKLRTTLFKDISEKDSLEDKETA